ncbi:MAG: hypothetical protein WB425_13910 [Terracidiphilus sp.]
MNLDFAAAYAESRERLLVVSNLPYYITSPNSFRAIRKTMRRLGFALYRH